MTSPSAPRHWVVDASPLILLERAGLARLLGDLAAEIAIPDAVLEEIERGGDATARRLVGSLRNVRRVTDLAIDPRVTERGLGAGESAVLSFALCHAGCEAILDDRAARNCADALGIPARGTLGILLLAKREGRLPAVAPALEALVSVGIYLDADVQRLVLTLAGEAE